MAVLATGKSLGIQLPAYWTQSRCACGVESSHGGANQAHDGCTTHRSPGCDVGSRCARGWVGDPLHEGGHGDRTSDCRLDLKLDHFLHWEALLSHCMNLEPESSHAHLDSLPVDVRRKGVGTRSTRELGAIPSSIICSTAGFWTLLSLSKPSPQLLLSNHKRSQAIAACLQWLQVGGERCW